MPGVSWSRGPLLDERPWLESTVATPAAEDPPPAPTRKRPLIYIYEMPPKFTQHMLQYRFASEFCGHRLYREGNKTVAIDHAAYKGETGIHEMIAQSAHRTLDPEVRSPLSTRATFN